MGFSKFLNSRRDALKEEEAALCAKRIFPKEDAPGQYAFEGGEEAVFSLLTEKLPELEKDGEVLVAERLRQLNANTRRAMTFGMTREGEKLLVKADFGGLTQQELEAAYLAYRQKKKYIRLAEECSCRVVVEAKTVEALRASVAWLKG